MGEEKRTLQGLEAEIERLKWRISTLENSEFECARAVSALAESEARYRRLLDEAGFPLTIAATSDSSVLFANPLACRFFGLDPERLGERRMLEFYADPGSRAAVVTRLRTQGVERDRETLMLDGEGRSRILIVTASLITYQGQEAILATSNDITERRKAEALFRTMVETSPDGFAIADLEGRLTYLSPGCLRIYRCQAETDMLGRQFQEFIPEAEHGRVQERLQAIAHGRYGGPSEWTGIRLDGTRFPQEINGEALRDPDGTLRAFFFIVRDLNNRKRVERNMRWAEKLESLGLMAAGIAHELNNAFQVTQGHLELAEGHCGQDPEMAPVLRGIKDGVDRATLLAREMLDYSGRALRVDTPVDLGHVVEEGIAFWREYLTSNACMIFHPGRDLPAIQGDEGQVAKVLSALVLNAVEAVEETGGSVVIGTGLRELDEDELARGFWPATGRKGRFLQLEVRDSGPGVAAELLERLCDPFYTTKGQGRGLGLSAALGILRGHSACLQLLSAPGQGATVRAYSPVATRAAAAPAAVPAAPTCAGVLVAEDDDMIRELVAHKLPDWGFGPVWTAKDGAEALELFQRHREQIGILLTDATMPVMSGPEAFEAMRRLKPALVGVLMTGFSDAFGQGTAAAFGFTDFLKKPFRFQDLKAKLEAARGGGNG